MVAAGSVVITANSNANNQGYADSVADMGGATLYPVLNEDSLTRLGNAGLVRENQDLDQLAGFFVVGTWTDASEDAMTAYMASAAYKATLPAEPPAA
jgi:hypothetical protein